MRHVDDATIRNALDLRVLTDATVSAFADLARGEASTTVRVRAKAEGGMASALAAVLPRRGVSGGKLYATAEGRFTFVVAVFDLDGHLLAVLDGGSLTVLRTAAGTGAAIRLLGGAGARIVTVIGTGRLCESHIDVICQEVPGIEELRVVGRREGPLADAARHAKALGLPVQACFDPVASVRDAELVVTLTSSTEPLFPGVALANGVLVCALGATKPDRRELDSAAVERAGLVVVDLLEGARAESGDLLLAESEGRFHWDRAVELGDVAAGNVPARSDAGITLFESQGIAMQDVLAASLVLERIG